MEALNRDLLPKYHRLVLAPLFADEPFDFGDWKPTMRAKKFVVKHPSFFSPWCPPRQGLLYFRGLAGIRGLLQKLDAELNIRSIFEQVIERRL